LLKTLSWLTIPNPVSVRLEIINKNIKLQIYIEKFVAVFNIGGQPIKRAELKKMLKHNEFKMYKPNKNTTKFK